MRGLILAEVYGDEEVLGRIWGSDIDIWNLMSIEKIKELNLQLDFTYRLRGSC